MRLSWMGFIATFVSIVAVLFLRRLLPPGRLNRGRTPLLLLVLSLLVRVASTVTDNLGWSTSRTFKILSFLDQLLLAFGITGVAGMLVFDILLARTRVLVAPILRDLVTAFVFVIILLTVLGTSGVNLLGIVTSATVLTAVIGLALQNTIQNLFAGLALQLDRMLNAGDWIQAGGHVGRIMQIKWRTTNLLTKDGDVVTVPNGELMRERITNFSKPTPMHRAWLRVGFHYRHPPNTVKRVLLAAVEGAPGVLETPAPDVVPLEFGESAIVYGLRYWIEDFERDARIDGEVRTRVWYAALRAGLEIPFPTRTVLLHEIDEARLEAEAKGRLEDRLALVSRLELFAGLEAADRRLLAEGMKVARFAAGELILRQGQAGDSLYLIQKGEVTVRLEVDGAQREVATLKSGQIFGEMSLITGEPRTATCLARTDVSCYIIDHAAFQQVLDARPSIAEEVSRTLAHRQTELAAEREGLTAEAMAHKEAEASRRLLARIRNFFNLG